MKNKKIVIIGLDGANKATTKLIGVDTQLHDFISTIPPYTPPSWTSILTGVNPSKHGIIGWQKVDLKKNQVQLVTSKDVKYPRLSEILDKNGLSSILINLPITYPFSGIHQKDNTIIVSDWAAPKQTIFPKELEERYTEYLIDPPHSWVRYGKKEYPKKVKEYTKIRLELYYDLLEQEDWNLYFIVFSETDWFSHLFPQILEGKDLSIVTPTFKLINKFIEEVKSTADIVLIISDHGFQVIDKVFYVNEALAEKGFIHYNKIKSKLLQKTQSLIPKKFLANLIEKTNVSRSIVSYMTTNAEVFMVEPATWGVYLKDLDKSKVVAEALISHSEIRDVIPSSVIHKGLYAKTLPQLFVIPDKGVEFSHELKGIITEKTYKGDHEMHGIFYAYGDKIKKRIEFKQIPKVYDIAPTILHMFDLPIPKDMDGRVLTEIFEDNSEFLKRKPEYVDPNYYSEEKEKVNQVIKNLKISKKLMERGYYE